MTEAKHMPSPFAVRNHVHVFGDPNNLANARLVAVSSEMLSLLQDIVASDGMRPGHVAYLSRADITAMARAIITKATA